MSIKINYFYTCIVFGIVLLILLIFVSFKTPLESVNKHVSLNYNEGWLLYHVHDAVSGFSLYQSEWTTLNYPPGYFLFMASLVHVGLDPLSSSRILSLLSMSVTVGIVTIIVFKKTKNIYLSVFVCIIFLSVFTSVGRAYVGMGDPQFFAHVFILIATLFYLQYPKQKFGLFISAVCLVVGLMIKQSVISLPIALCVDAILDRNRFRKLFLLYFFSILISVTVFFQWSYQGLFLSSIFSYRNYNLSRIYMSFRSFVQPFLVILLGAAIGSFYEIFSNKSRVFSVYFFTALIASFYFAGGVGINVNIFFDLYISMIICMSVGLSALLQKRIVVLKAQKVIFMSFLVFILSQQVYLQIIELIQYPKTFSSPEQTQKDSLFIQMQTGPVICETLLLCYLAHKPFIFDPFLMFQEFTLHPEKESIFLSLVKQQHFSMIQMEQEITPSLISTAQQLESKYEGRFTSQTMQTIQNYYTPVYRSTNGIFYTPRLIQKNKT